MSLRARKAAGSKLMCPQSKRSKPLETDPCGMRIAECGGREPRAERFLIAILITARKYRSLPPRPLVIHVSLAGNAPGDSGISRGTATTSEQLEWAQIAVRRSRLNLAIPPKLPNASGTSASTRSGRLCKVEIRDYRTTRPRDHFIEK